MKDADNTFRIHLRLNRIEYADLIADIESHAGNGQTARVRMLLRRGLLSENGAIPASYPVAAEGQTKITREKSTAPAPAKAVVMENALDRFNLDPTAFSFGEMK